MSTSTVRTDNGWDIKILRYELNQLRREQEHLTSKSNERPLTTWENTRIEGIAEEITMLVKKLVNFQMS